MEFARRWKALSEVDNKGVAREWIEGFGSKDNPKLGVKQIS